MKLVQNLTAFSGITSIHGLNYIAKTSSSKKIRFAWFCLFTASLGYAIIMISYEAKGKNLCLVSPEPNIVFNTAVLKILHRVTTYALSKWGDFDRAKTTLQMLLASWFLVYFFKRFTTFDTVNVRFVDKRASKLLAVKAGDLKKKCAIRHQCSPSRTSEPGFEVARCPIINFNGSLSELGSKKYKVGLNKDGDVFVNVSFTVWIESPTITVVETLSHPINEVPFPAVTLCPRNFNSDRWGPTIKIFDYLQKFCPMRE